MDNRRPARRRVRRVFRFSAAALVDRLDTLTASQQALVAAMTELARSIALLAQSLTEDDLPGSSDKTLDD